MYPSLISKICLRIGVGAFVLFLVCWLYFRSRAAEVSARHYAVLYGVPSMLSSAVEAWVSDEGISDDRVQVVNEDFIGILSGNNRLQRAYLFDVDKNDYTHSDLRYTVVIDGDHDGFYRGLIPLSARVVILVDDARSLK